MNLKNSYVWILTLLILNGIEGSKTKGIDISAEQTDVNWASVKADGIAFVYIRATNGSDYISPKFGKQLAEAKKVGLIRGAYHTANSSKSSGSDQANFFVSHGGGWNRDGKTLPGAIELVGGCYTLNPKDMAIWIMDFSNTYHGRAGRYPVIFTSTDWWEKCTGNAKGFGRNNPLWIIKWSSSHGPLPGDWKFTTFWQNADGKPKTGGLNFFLGDEGTLKMLARG